MSSSIEATPDNFVRAVETLYHDQDATRKKFASEWLLNVQSSLYAWSLADQLIRRNQNSEVTCLSAQILRHKIQHNFDELPVEHCKPLCDSLLEHLTRTDLTRNSTVRVQLAVATADLALQYVGWEKPVEDVVERLKTSNEHLLTLLEFLTALPEEVNTSTIRIGENRRRFCREKYSNYGKQIHDILIFVLHINSTSDESLFIGILKCFASWINIEAFNDALLLSSPLLKTILDILKSTNCSNELHKNACDCLCNILELCEEYQKYWSLIVYLKKEINEYFVKPYFQSVKDENLDKAQNYTRIYTNLIESIVDCLVDGRQSELSDLSCLHLIIYPLEHTDYEIVQSTFYTWYRLSELIQSFNDEILIEKIKPYLEKVIDILCGQCKLDSDHLGIPPETDEKISKTTNSDLGEFRYRVECLIKDTIFITGALNCFRHMFEKLEKSISLSWEESEAPLYIMSCVASYLPLNEEKYVPNLIQLIISTPTDIGIVHTALKYTGVRLLSELNEWISKNDQKYLKSILGYLLSLLTDKDLRFVSANAILTICHQCKKQLINDLEQIIQAAIWLDQTENGSTSAQCLLKASSKLISRLTSKDDIQKYLQILFDQQIHCLTQILSIQLDSNFSSIVKRLDCLTAIFRSLDFKSINIEAEFCVNLVQKLYPFIELIIIRYRSSSKLSECWSRTIRFIIRSMSSYAKTFFQPIVTLIVTSYDDVAHSCFLYLISIIVDEYGNDQDLVGAIISMSEHLTRKTFSILANQNGFQLNPDLVDDFYRLSSRLLQRCSYQYLQSNQIDQIIEQIISNCNFEHRDASGSMMAFIQSLAKLTSNQKKDKHAPHLNEIRQLATNFSEKYFPKLLTGLLRAIVIDRVPSAVRLSISECISDMKFYMPNKFSLWLHQSLNEIPRTTKNGLVEIVTQQQQQQFYQILTQPDTQPSTIEDELERYARLYR